MTPPKEVKTVYHFDKDDVEFNGDYREIDVVFDGVVVYNVGDEYHDKGSDRVYGFICACEYIWGIEIEVVDEKVADWDY